MDLASILLALLPALLLAGAGMLVGWVLARRAQRGWAEEEGAEEALRVSEERFRQLAESIPEVFWVSTPGLQNVVYVSPAYERVWGRPASELYADPLAWVRGIHPEDRERVMAALAGHLQGEYEAEYRVVRPDGTVRWIRDRGFPVRDAKGELKYVNGIAEDVTDRKEAREAQRVRELAAHIEAAREQERGRVAREIHDELGQALTGLRYEVSWLSKHVPASDPRLGSKLAEIEALIDSTIQSVRTLVAELRPQILDHSGLLSAIEWQADEFRKRTGIPCTLSLPDREVVWNPDRSIAMFRILQESLTNVARHAGATRVGVRLSEELGAVVLEVEDDGRGITNDQASDFRSFGLLSMQERARLLGGTLSVRGQSSGGTRVTARIPRRDDSG